MPTATFTYDNNGNTLSKADSAGTTNYTWDFENRLTSVVGPAAGTATFEYDPFGRRTQKASSGVTTNFLYDGNAIIAETDFSGNEVIRFVQGSGVDEPMAEIRMGVVGYYEQDALGSVTSLSNNLGTLSNTYAYDSFGNITASTSSLVNSFQYTGREYDPETGLLFYRARYYDQVTGRFLSEDPIRFRGGRNFYSYVLDNPINLVDPFGKQSNSVDSSMMQAIGRGNSAEIQEILDDAGETLSDKAKQAAQEAIKKLRSKAKDWIAQKCKGSVNQEFPEELREKTLEEIKNLARGKGDLADKAKTAWKLLTDSRFQK